MHDSADELKLPADHAQRMARARLSLEGLSVGDAFGEDFFRCILPLHEGSAPASNPTYPGPWYYTDDTIMAISVVEVLGLLGRIDQDRLAAAFARRYADQPDRGYGGGAQKILRAIGDGIAWRVAAGSVFGGQGSMGNGSAMRVAPAGAYFADDLTATVQNAVSSAEVTHAHPDAKAGAIAIAVAAAMAWQTRQLPQAQATREVLATVLTLTPDGPTRSGLTAIERIGLDCSVEHAADTLGNGSSIRCADTVPFCVWAACRNLRSYKDAVWETVSALGDRDTTCAIVGSIVALAVGQEGIPKDWLATREPLPF